MRGTREYPMHRYPFDMLCSQRLNEQGQPLGPPLWLLIWGTDRATLSPVQVQQAYAQRFQLEHFFGFAKAHLPLTAFQSAHTAHEINAVRPRRARLWTALVGASLGSDAAPALAALYADSESAATHPSTVTPRICSTYSADWVDCPADQNPRYLTWTCQRHSVEAALSLPMGEVSSAAKAVPLQSLAKVGLTLH